MPEKLLTGHMWERAMPATFRWIAGMARSYRNAITPPQPV